MLYKTRGIVLKLTNYRDSSVIAQLFTEQFGLQSYVIHGAKKPKAKIRINMLQPMQLLDLVVSNHSRGGLQRISDLQLAPPFTTIPYEIGKSSVVLFLNEILYKILRHQTEDEPIFQFLFNAISWLDSVEKLPANFHLYFLIRLSRYLGFYPAEKQGGASYFDLKNGVFVRSASQPYILHPPHADWLADLMSLSLEELSQFRIPAADRSFLLEKILDFYRFHMDYLGEIKSHKILEEVLQ